MYAWHKTQIINFCSPFKSQYPHTNSPNWSPYISLKNYVREFGKRLNIFLFVIILSILIDFAHDSLWKSLGENWSWALLGVKGLMLDINLKFPLCFTGKCGTILKENLHQNDYTVKPCFTGTCFNMDTSLLWAVVFVPGETLTFSVNLTHLIWTPVNADNRHLFLAQSTESHRKSTSVMRTSVNCLLK